MTSQDLTITAWRFVHGKLVREPGGPVTPGFEHQATSISQGLPEGLLPYCRPQEILGNRSVQALVHPQRERDGALLLRPACCDGRRYLLATCVRARPESGDGGLSRTHTQLVTFVFSEADWNAQAPRLIANAGLWLRAEPDTVAFHEQYRDHGDYPPVVLGPEELPEVPPCAAGPLPRGGNLLWRLTGALELAGQSLVCGAADRIDSVGTFLRALACASALLPEPLRIYLTAAAGFAEVQDQTLFALQYLPEAAALPSAAPGLLEQLAGRLLGENPAANQEGWQRSWRPEAGADRERVRRLRVLGAPAHWQTTAAARTLFGQVVDDLTASYSLRDLAAWLAGARSGPPDRPALRHASLGTKWAGALTRRVNERGAGRPAVGLGRALTRIATLIDTDGASPVRQQEQADYWARAWRSAAAAVGEPRSVLRWSAVSASRLADDPADAPRRELGWLKDFGELRVIAAAMQRAVADTPADAEVIDRRLRNAAFERRVDDLRGRADGLLIRQPLAIIDLAAALPVVPPPRPDDDAWHGLEETVRAILIAARLYGWTDTTVPDGQQDLALAAQQVAERLLTSGHSHDDLRSHDQNGADDDCKALLGRYRQWALATDADHDHADILWCEGICLAICLRAREQGLPGAIRLLLNTCHQGFEDPADTRADRARLRTTAAALFDRCLEAVAELGQGPAKTASELVLSLPELSHLAPQSDDPFVTYEFAEALDRGLGRALQDQRAGPHDWIADFLPVLSGAIGDWLADPQNQPTPRLTRRLLALADLALERSLQAAVPLPREPLTELFAQLDQLLHRVPPGGADLAAAIDPLALNLARCILAWADADPPEPWFDPTWFAAETEPAERPLGSRLADRLGFPRCAYFAALCPWPDQARGVRRVQVRGASDAQGRPTQQLTPALLQLSPDASTSIGKVIAYGAAKTWRGLDERGLFQPDYLSELFMDAVTDEVIAACCELALDGSSPYQSLIDDETRFAVGFCVSLDQVRSPLGRLPIPQTLRAALLSDGSLHDRSYALRLARMIAASGAAGGGRLNAWFQNEINYIAHAWIPTRVLLLESDWNDFAQLDEPDRQHGLLRLLFLLGLISQPRTWRRSQGGRVKVDRYYVEATLRLPHSPAIEKEMAQFFARNRNFAAAFAHALALANIDGLACWRRAIQPLENQ